MWNKGDDVCNCKCHFGENIKHFIACCGICHKCGDRIRTGAMQRHEQECNGMPSGLCRWPVSPGELVRQAVEETLARQKSNVTGRRKTQCLGQRRSATASAIGCRTPAVSSAVYNARAAAKISR